MSELTPSLDVVQSLSGQEWPKITATTQTDDVVGIRLLMHDELIWFKGHYPTMPILPGVAQVHLAAAYGKHVFDIQGTFVGMDAVKFSSVVKPGFELDLSLVFNVERETLRFSFAHDQTLCSSGRILFSSAS